MRPSLRGALVVVAITTPMSLMAAGPAQPQLGGVTPPQLGAGVPVDDPADQPAAGRNPFKGLFRSPLQPSPKDREPSRSQSTARTPDDVREREATIVCGMTVQPFDPAFDAAIRRVVPQSGARPAVRTVPPPACRR